MKYPLIAAGALALVSLTGCQYVAVGDSLLWQSRQELKSNLLPANFNVDASSGRGPDSPGIDGSPSLRQTISNDLQQVDHGGWLIVQEAGDQAVTPEFVRWVVEHVPADVQLAWVTPNNIWNDPMNEASVRAITEGLAGRPGAVVIAWDQVDTELLSTDGIHLNAKGEMAYAALIAEHVR